MNIYLLPVYFYVVLCVTTMADNTTSLPDTTGIVSTGKSLSTTIDSTSNIPGNSPESTYITSSSIYKTQNILDVKSSTALQTDTSTFSISTSSDFVLSSLEASPTGSALTFSISTSSDFVLSSLEASPTGSALTFSISTSSDFVLSSLEESPTGSALTSSVLIVSETNTITTESTVETTTGSSLTTSGTVETNNSRSSEDTEVTPTQTSTSRDNASSLSTSRDNASSPSTIFVTNLSSALLQTTLTTLDSENVIFGMNSSSYESTELISTFAMPATTQTEDHLLSSGITDGFNSGITASSITPTNIMSINSSNSTYLTMLSSFSNEMYNTSRSINSLPSAQITENSDVLSSFSSTYDSPVILTLHSSRSYSPETSLFSSEPIYSSNSVTEISKVITQNGIGTTPSSEIVVQTTPVSLSITSALDTMSTVTPLDSVYVDFQKQIEDLKDTENSYMIAVIVLALIIAVLILVIVLYGLRRRRYSQRKQLTLGMDEDLLDGYKKKQRPHFNTGQSGDLRISGRVSTATLGNEDQPLKVLESFNKSEDRKQESNAESEKTKFDDVKDEEL